MRPMIDAVAAVGDVADARCWSGLPYHCLQAARRLGWETKPWRLHLEGYVWPRRLWNLRQAALLRGVGGYQTSRSFLDRAERDFMPGLSGRRVLSFHHQFPRASSVRRAGGRVVYYLDATLGSLLDGHGLDLRLPRHAAASSLATERENLDGAEHVFVMARWLRDYLLERRLVRPERLSVVMPGANLDVPDSWSPPEPPVRKAGRPFILGLVGNDWERKGLPLLIQVARKMRLSGADVRIRVVGRCPADIDPSTTDVVGPIDKRTDLARFIEAVAGCDVGCLFSKREALGVSVLEFLRVGVPVAGFAHEGPADTLPADAGLRFSPGSDAEAVTAGLLAYVRDVGRRAESRAAALRWSGRVTWERSLREIAGVLGEGPREAPLEPWAARA